VRSHGHVRFGSLADAEERIRDVRFTAESGHAQERCCLRRLKKDVVYDERCPKFGARPFVRVDLNIIRVDLKIRSTEMRASIARFVKDEAGATAIEYAVIAGGISIAIVTVVGAIGTSLTAMFTAVNDGFAQ